MNKFFKRIHVKLIDIDRKRSWLLERTGISPSTWSSWEKHDRIPPADRALAVADALGVSLEYLLTGRETPLDFRGTSPVLLEIYNRLLSMSDDQLRQVLTAVNTIAISESE